MNSASSVQVWSASTSLITSRAKQSLAAPGVPRSPAPNGVDASHQLAPTLLSSTGFLSAIEAPLGSGKVAPLSHSTRSTSLAKPSSSTSSSEPLARKKLDGYS